MMCLFINVVMLLHLVVAVWVLFCVSLQGFALCPMSRRPESPNWRLTGDSRAPHHVATHVVLIDPGPLSVSILVQNLDHAYMELWGNKELVRSATAPAACKEEPFRGKSAQKSEEEPLRGKTIGTLRAETRTTAGTEKSPLAARGVSLQP